MDDKSGNVLSERIESGGYVCVDRALVKDAVVAIVTALRKGVVGENVDVVISTGGPGAGRDVTLEALAAVYEKEIPGFGELFPWLGYSRIGAVTIQLHATAGLAGGTYLFALPGSPSACRDGWEMILKHQLDSRTRPCNFVALMPRLQEK